MKRRLGEAGDCYRHMYLVNWSGDIKGDPDGGQGRQIICVVLQFDLVTVE